MAEEATARKTTGRPRTVTDAVPESMGPDATGMGEIEKVIPIPASALDLRKYVDYRLAQLNTPVHGGRLGGAAGVNSHSVRVILNELLEMAAWLEKGAPSPKQSLTEGDKQFWREAKARGVTVDPEIEAQL